VGASSLSYVEVDEIREKARLIIDKLSSVVIGYREEMVHLLTALLANGHVLLEGVPGIAKTTLARALTRLLGLSEKSRVTINGVAYTGFSRIQFTPDLMPSDITGSLVYNPRTLSFEPRLGPIFAYIVLADEINRATPRTQSAMLQAMQEREVTIGDTSYPLEVRDKGKFFFVIATQNPVEQEGTYPLPEAQLDRFMMRIVMWYPASLEEEKSILKLHAKRIREPYQDLEPVVEPEWVVKAQNTVAEKVEVSEEALEFIVRIARASRPEVSEPVAKYFELGLSPRGAIQLLKAVKAHAAIRGSSIAEPQDVDAVLFPVVNHRLIPRIEKIVEFGGGFKARLRVLREGVELIKKTA